MRNLIATLTLATTLSSPSFATAFTYELSGYFDPSLPGGGTATGPFKEVFSYDSEQPLLTHATSTSFQIGELSSATLAFNGGTLDMHSDLDGLQYVATSTGSLLSIIGRIGPGNANSFTVRFSYNEQFDLRTGILTDGFICSPKGCATLTMGLLGVDGPSGKGIVTSFRDITGSASVPEPATASLLGAGVLTALFMQKRKRRITKCR